VPAANPIADASPLRTSKPPPPPIPKDPLVEALQCILDNRPEDAIRHLESFDPSTQELLLQLLPFVRTVKEKGLDRLDGRDVAVMYEQLQGMLHSLRPRTELLIGRMCFCESIRSYGQYKPLPEGHTFAAAGKGRAGEKGSPGELVQLYVEVRNFSSERRDGYYETRFSSFVEIRDAKDPPEAKPIWFWRFDDHKQPIRVRAPLQDYFNNYRFEVPALPPGTYRLTIHVADETHPDRRREAHQSLEFRVSAMPVRGQ
jgi:hypothetical protein